MGKFVRQWSRDLYQFRIFSNFRIVSFDPLEILIVAESEGGTLLEFRLKESNKVTEFNWAKEIAGTFRSVRCSNAKYKID